MGFNAAVGTASTASTAHMPARGVKKAARILMENASVSSTASSAGPPKSRLPFRGMKREKSVKMRHKATAELRGIQHQMEQTLGHGNHDRHQERKEVQHQLDQTHLDEAEAEEGELTLNETAKQSELIVSLLETNRRNVVTVQHSQTLLSAAMSKNESAKVEVSLWKQKHEATKQENMQLIKRMATKSREQLRSHTEMTKAEVEDWKGKYAQMGQLYDVLVEKVGALAVENGDLQVKCQKLEEEDEKIKEELEGIQEECDVLHLSMEEAVQLASGMSKNMVN